MNSNLINKSKNNNKTKMSIHNKPPKFVNESTTRVSRPMANLLTQTTTTSSSSSSTVQMIRRRRRTKTKRTSDDIRPKSPDQNDFVLALKVIQPPESSPTHTSSSHKSQIAARLRPEMSSTKALITRVVLLATLLQLQLQLQVNNCDNQAAAALLPSTGQQNAMYHHHQQPSRFTTDLDTPWHGLLAKGFSHDTTTKTATSGHMTQLVTTSRRQKPLRRFERSLEVDQQPETSETGATGSEERHQGRIWRASNEEKQVNELHGKNNKQVTVDTQMSNNASSNDWVSTIGSSAGDHSTGNHRFASSPSSSSPASSSRSLQIVRLFAPEAIQNGTTNVTIDCMFKFDKKLDQRLTVKWYLNDELEPIYQWIPELNKRVYSDKYEHFLDKTYQVTEDVDFMLDAYKLQLENSIAAIDQQQQQAPLPVLNQPATEHDHHQAAGRRLLASRLNRLAKFGGQQSRQLLQTLRSSLAMDEPDFARFRALRLIKPTAQMNGQFTCSVSSLESDDLRSTKLIVYEPAKSFTFNVSRASNNAYNLTCQASLIFPRPTLTLFRLRAGPTTIDTGNSVAQQHQTGANKLDQRPKLASTSLRPEPLINVQTQVTISAINGMKSLQRDNELDRYSQIGRNSREIVANDNLNYFEANNEIIAANEPAPSNQRISIDNNDNNDDESRSIVAIDLDDSGANRAAIEANNQQARQQTATQLHNLGAYKIASWALVDESTLSANLATQFECILTIEGANYEQKQSLALQKGWHVNSSSALSMATRSTLVGLFSALASLLCLIVALFSSMLIFKLLRRHANLRRRVHQQHEHEPNQSPGGTGNKSSTSRISQRSLASDSSTGSGVKSPQTTRSSAPEKPKRQQQQQWLATRDKMDNVDLNENKLIAGDNASDCSTGSTTASGKQSLATPTSDLRYHQLQQQLMLGANNRKQQQPGAQSSQIYGETGHYNVPTLGRGRKLQQVLPPPAFSSVNGHRQMTDRRQSQADAIYRVPQNEPSTFGPVFSGSRFVIGHQSALSTSQAADSASGANDKNVDNNYLFGTDNHHLAMPQMVSSGQRHHQQHQQQHQQQQQHHMQPETRTRNRLMSQQAGLTPNNNFEPNINQQQHDSQQNQQLPLNVTVNGRPLYC